VKKLLMFFRAIGRDATLGAFRSFSKWMRKHHLEIAGSIFRVSAMQRQVKNRTSMFALFNVVAFIVRSLARTDRPITVTICVFAILAAALLFYYFTRLVEDR
jgi:hypothetical protein